VPSTSFTNNGFFSDYLDDPVLILQTNGCFTDYVEGQVENSHRLELFLDILEETIMVGDRLLLFSQSLFTLNLIEDYLKRRQVPGESMRCSVYSV